MRFIRYSGYIILTLLGSALIFSALLPSEKIIRHSISINKSDNFVFQQVVDFKNWIKWNHWSELEPSASNIISGEPKGEGSVWTWKGNLISGTISIDSVVPYNLIILNLSICKTFKISALSKWTFKSDSTKTLIVWENESKLDYPMERFKGLFLEKELGRDMLTSLQNLKKLCENK